MNLEEIFNLPAAERLQLVQDIWDSLIPEEVPVTAEQRAELERRVEAIDSGVMGPGEPWETVRDGLLKR